MFNFIKSNKSSDGASSDKKRKKKAKQNTISRMRFQPTVEDAILSELRHLSEESYNNESSSVGTLVREVDGYGFPVILISSDMLDSMKLEQHTLGSIESTLKNEDEVVSVATQDMIDLGLAGIAPTRNAIELLDELGLFDDVQFELAIVPYQFSRKLAVPDIIETVDESIYDLLEAEMGDYSPFSLGQLVNALNEGYQFEVQEGFEDGGVRGYLTDPNEIEDEFEEPVEPTEAVVLPDSDKLDSDKDNSDEIDNPISDNELDGVFGTDDSNPANNVANDDDDSFDTGKAMGEDLDIDYKREDEDNTDVDEPDNTEPDEDESDEMVEGEMLTAEEVRQKIYTVEQAVSYRQSNTLNLDPQVERFNNEFTTIEPKLFDEESFWTNSDNINDNLEQVLADKKRLANMEIQRVHDKGMIQLKQAFIEASEKLRQSIEAYVSEDNNEGFYAKDLQRSAEEIELQKEKNEILRADKRRELTDELDKRLENRIEQATRLVKANFNIEHEGFIQDKLNEFDKEMKQSLENRQEDLERDIHRRRRERANTLYQKGLSDLFAMLKESWDKLQSYEQDLYDHHFQAFDDFVERQYNNEIIRAKAIQNDIDRTNKIGDLQEEMNIALERKEKEIQSIKNAHVQELNRLNKRRESLLADQKRSFEDNLSDLESSHKREINKQESIILKLRNDIEEQKQKERSRLDDLRSSHQDLISHKEAEISRRDMTLMQKDKEIDDLTRKENELRASEQSVINSTRKYVLLSLLIGFIMGALILIIAAYVSGKVPMPISTISMSEVILDSFFAQINTLPKLL